MYKLALIPAVFGLDLIELDWVSKNGPMSNSELTNLHTVLRRAVDDMHLKKVLSIGTYL